MSLPKCGNAFRECDFSQDEYHPNSVCKRNSGPIITPRKSRKWIICECGPPYRPPKRNAPGRSLAACKPKPQKPPVYQIVLVCHGETHWDKDGLFTGWYNAPLNKNGRREAIAAGEAIRRAGFKFNVAFTSVLSRSIDCLHIILANSKHKFVHVRTSWCLNDRHYGDLTGMNWQDAVCEYGEDQVQLWHRSYDVPPPPIDFSNQYYEDIIASPNFAEGPPRKEFPKGESVRMTVQRVMRYWKQVIVPALKKSKKIIIVAHEDSLRGLIMHLNKISEEDIMEVNIPTGIPIYYKLNAKFKPIVSMKFLDVERIDSKKTK